MKIKSLYQISGIHKQVHYGITNKLPVFLLFIAHFFLSNLKRFRHYYINIEDKIAGFILYDKKKKKIIFIEVAKEFQSKGIGSRLISLLPKEDILVAFDINNNPLKKFYYKNGFRPYKKGWYDLIYKIKYEYWIKQQE